MTGSYVAIEVVDMDRDNESHRSNRVGERTSIENGMNDKALVQNDTEALSPVQTPKSGDAGLLKMNEVGHGTGIGDDALPKNNDSCVGIMALDKRKTGNDGRKLPNQDGGPSESASSIKIIVGKVDINSLEANSSGASASKELTQNLAIVKLGRVNSFIRPENAPSFWESVTYSFKTVATLLIHSILLSVIPIGFIMLVYGSVRIFDVNFESMLLYYLVASIILSFGSYLLVLVICYHAFGSERVRPLIFKISFPCFICFVASFSFRVLHDIASLSFVYFGVYVFHFYLLYRSVKETPRSDQSRIPSEAKDRYHILSSDGTPLALLKIFLASAATYYAITYYLIPIFIDAYFLKRIMGRVIVLPFLVNVVDLTQNSLLAYKSEELMKYRFMLANIFNFIVSAILRLYISSSRDLYETAVISVSTGFVSVILRITYIARTIYTTRMMYYLKHKISTILDRNQVHNMGGIVPNPDARDAIEQSEVRIKEITVTLTGIKKLAQQLNRKDRITNYIVSCRLNRVYFVSVCELQFVVYLPLVLYLSHPIRGFVTYNTISKPETMILSMLVQLFVEIVVQVSSHCIENYIYGFKVPMEKVLTQLSTPSALAMNGVISLAMLYLAALPFWRYISEWPRD